MGVDEILNKYDFVESYDESIKRITSDSPLHPVYKKWLGATFDIQDIWGYVEVGLISLSKARELTASVIEQYSILNNNDREAITADNTPDKA